MYIYVYSVIYIYIIYMLSSSHISHYETVRQNGSTRRLHETRLHETPISVQTECTHSSECRDAREAADRFLNGAFPSQTVSWNRFAEPFRGTVSWNRFVEYIYVKMNIYE